MKHSLSHKRLTLTYVTALVIIGGIALATTAVQQILINNFRDVSQIRDLANSVLYATQERSLLIEETREATSRPQELVRLVRLTQQNKKNLEMVIPQLVAINQKKIRSAVWNLNGLSNYNHQYVQALADKLKDFLLTSDHFFTQLESETFREHEYKAQYGELMALFRSIHIDMESFINLTNWESQFRLNGMVKVLWMFLLFFILSLLGMGLVLFRPLILDVMESHRQENYVRENLQRRAAELSDSRESMRQQTRILKSILDALADAVIVIGEHGGINLQNPAADQLFGVESQSFDLQSWHEQLAVSNVDGEPLPLEDSPLCQAISGRRVHKHLLSVRDITDGQYAHKILSSNGRPIFDEDGRSRGAVISFRDVTEEIADDKELLFAKSKAEDANHAKNEFIANVSHEIRTPVASILGFADRLTLADLDPKIRKKSIDMIRKNGRILVRLIDDLLDISRIEAGQNRIELSPIAIVDLFAEIREMMSPRALKAGLELSFKNIGPVPRTMVSDRVRVRQILLNLIGNAIKFTESGSVKVMIYWDKDYKGKAKLAISVQDTGCGIPHESFSKLFQPFVQMDSSATRRFGGTGLGLALSKRLALALGGDLELLESAVDVGTTFVLRLDVGPSEDLIFESTMLLPDVQDSKKDEPIFPTSGLEGMRILVVEDGPENRELFGFTLTHAGAQVDEAENGIEGLKLAVASDYDVIFMDIQMPLMDGMEALREMRKSGVIAPIIALTAHAMDEHRERSLDAGFDYHLCKPIEASALVTAAEIYGSQDDFLNVETHESNVPRSVNEIIAKFARSIPDRVQEMLAAWDDSNWELLSSLVHRLKGTAGVCGFHEISERVAHIEVALNSKSDLVRVRKDIEELVKFKNGS